MSDAPLETRKRWTLAVLLAVALGLALLPVAVATGWLGGGSETVRVAFVPFEAPGGDPDVQEAASAVTNSLHSRFAQQHDPRFTLLSPTLASQYRGQDLLPARIGQRLRADVVVAGQLLRDTATAGAQVAVSAQLVRARDGRALWSGRWQLGDPTSGEDRRRVVDWLEDRLDRTLQTVKP